MASAGYPKGKMCEAVCARLPRSIQLKKVNIVGGDVSLVLIVDDEEDLLNLLDINLRREGFSTEKASSARAALEFLETGRPDLIILDLMLPDIPGTEVCRRVRANADTAEIPIIMLTAKGEEIDRVVGFEVGADDYVVKSSFSVREMILRVRAVLRRRGEAKLADTPQRIELGRVSVDEAAHRVWVDGDEILLTATEFKLLWTLASNAGRVQTRGSLLEEVWDMPADLNTRTVDTHVKRLREKLLGAAGAVETVRGVGYRFNKSAV
jgi:two-component system, OmpR family, phosphate regulon response regulator PhoB